jgi:hypothetical protein
MSLEAHYVAAGIVGPHILVSDGEVRVSEILPVCRYFIPTLQIPHS